MTQEVNTLTDEQGKTLAQAYSEYKTAQAKFELIKRQLTQNISVGKHITKYAIINKIVKTRKDVNYKQACLDNQLDLTEYTTVQRQDPTITIQPLVVEEEVIPAPKKSILNIF